MYYSSSFFFGGFHKKIKKWRLFAPDVTNLMSIPSELNQFLYEEIEHELYPIDEK